MGPILVAVVGTLLAGLIATGGAVLQARSQQQVVRLQLSHERDEAEASRRAAVEDEHRHQERDLLRVLLRLELDIEWGDDESHRKPFAFEEAQSIAQQVDDPVLHQMVEDNPYGGPHVRKRIGYLLRTPTADRTPTGHE